MRNQHINRNLRAMPYFSSACFNFWSTRKWCTHWVKIEKFLGQDEKSTHQQESVRNALFFLRLLQFLINKSTRKWRTHWVKITERNTSGTELTHKHTQRLFNLTIHTHIYGAVHTLFLDHVHLHLSPPCTTVHSVVHVIQAALTFLNLEQI